MQGGGASLFKGSEKDGVSNMWITLILVVHVVVAIAVIGLVLLQHGKGADVGASFGGGSSGSLFGATGSANFLSRATAVLAAIFFITSLGLAYVATNKPREAGGVMDAVKELPAGVAPSSAAGSSDPAKPAAAKVAEPKANEVPK